MGTDTYPVLGSFRDRKLAEFELVQVDIVNLGKNDVSFLNASFSEDSGLPEIKRNYKLFSWLGDWDNNEVGAFLNEEDQKVRRSLVDWIRRHDREMFMHCRPIVYTLRELLKFDYNKACPKGETYRELFEGSNLIPFLEAAQKEGWDFVVFQFD